MIKDDKNIVFNVNDVLDNQSSVKLTKTSRGTSWKVKIYNNNPETALEIADKIYKECEKKYGGSNE